MNEPNVASSDTNSSGAKIVFAFSRNCIKEQ